MNILISACLLGLCTRYDGGDNAIDLARLSGHTLVPVCPEQLGGLPTPRVPAERQPDGRVRDKQGADVTRAFQDGADMAMQVYTACHCRAALLKARSPSCGAGVVYDGTFTGTLVPGDGVTAERLKQAGIPVFTEEEVGELADYLRRMGHVEEG